MVQEENINKQWGGGVGVGAVKACHFSALHVVDFRRANLCETDLGLENQEHITR